MSYIERETALEFVLNNTPHINGETTMKCVERAIKAIPAADVVEVVRCKDCKWWTKQTDSMQGRCALSVHYPTGYWYCYNGERSEDET